MVHSASLKSDQPSMRVFVLTGDQTGLARVVEASTTTEAFVAQEILQPNWFVGTLKLGVVVRITGYGKHPWGRWMTTECGAPSGGSGQIIDDRIAGI